MLVFLIIIPLAVSVMVAVLLMGIAHKLEVFGLDKPSNRQTFLEIAIPVNLVTYYFILVYCKRRIGA